MRWVALVGFLVWAGCDSSTEAPPRNVIDDCFQCPTDTDFLPDGDAGGQTPEDAAPDVAPDADAVPEDAPDTASDAFNLDATEDEPFVRPRPDMGQDAAPDTRDTNPAPTELHGFHDCYEWTLTVNQTVFTVKEENIPVFYEVHNTCHTDLRLRTMHSSDFFAVGIHKDGLPWVFLPDCPGTGRPEEQVFGRGDGWARGYIWSPADFDARLARCNVTFEEGARYSIVGYGLEPVPFSDPTAWSEIYVLTDEIEIQLLR